MTQFRYVSEKEMRKETGVKNALGYTFPKEKKILLKKGLKGKLREEVIEHELNHLARGEEGPWISAAIGAGASLFGAKKSSDAMKDASSRSAEATAQARRDLSPYRKFGRTQMGSMADWLATPEGTFRPPTMEDVRMSPGYDTRLDAIENSAVGPGGAGLLSGNALRGIGEFGAAEYDREYARRQNLYQNELAKRMGFANLGLAAANQSSGLSQNYGQQQLGYGQSMGNIYNNLAGNIGGAAGAWQGQKNFENFLSAYRKS